MLSAIVQEETKLEAMQRVWQPNRRASSMALFESESERKTCILPRQNSCGGIVTNGQCTSPPPFLDAETELVPETCQLQEAKTTFETVKDDLQKLDAGELGDLPARYTIAPLEPHQFPVVGVFIDKRVIPGFKYRVRPLPGIQEKTKVYPCLFNDRALVLESIGRGYAKRFTFESDKNCLNNNDNYFWSDNRPEGFAFELEVISEGDKFTIFDVNKESQATCEVLKIEGAQSEISCNVRKESIEKRVKVKIIAKVEFFETGVAKPMHLNGVAICIKRRGAPKAEITKVINVSIKHHRYYMVPGVQKVHRRVTVKGVDINDVPTKYTMNGLESYEIPVVGTYIDPRIIPGFYYRVRPNHRKEHLFDGRSLKLLSLGMGYAKRLTFQPDSLVKPDNYLWSDNHPDGLGLEPRAVHKGMKFTIMAGDQILGEASVFRTDAPQIEEKMQKIQTSKGYVIEKHILIDVKCHVKLCIADTARCEEEQLMRVCGLAIVRKEPKSNDSYIVRVENIGLDSSLNIIFARNHTELTFIPIAQPK